MNLDLMFDIFKMVLMCGGIFTTMLGILTVWYWGQTSKAPADESNRLNNIESWWLGLTRTDVLASAYKFYQQDLLDNMADVQTTVPQAKNKKY